MVLRVCDSTSSNVTLWYEGRPFPCPVCGAFAPLRRAKTKKPYLVCELCGIQLFFRGKRGIKKLGDMLGVRKASPDVPGFNPVLDRFATLRNRLREIQEQKPVFGENSLLELEERALRAEVKQLSALLHKQLQAQKDQTKKAEEDA